MIISSEYMPQVQVAHDMLFTLPSGKFLFDSPLFRSRKMRQRRCHCSWEVEAGAFHISKLSNDFI